LLVAGAGPQLQHQQSDRACHCQEKGSCLLHRPCHLVILLDVLPSDLVCVARDKSIIFSVCKRPFL
jgi:hypothetical protein